METDAATVVSGDESDWTGGVACRVVSAGEVSVATGEFEVEVGLSLAGVKPLPSVLVDIGNHNRSSRGTIGFPELSTVSAIIRRKVGNVANRK